MARSDLHGRSGARRARNIDRRLARGAGHHGGRGCGGHDRGDLAKRRGHRQPRWLSPRIVGQGARQRIFNRSSVDGAVAGQACQTRARPKCDGLTLRRSSPPGKRQSGLRLTRELKMSASERLTSVVSAKGQVILPKVVLERNDWPPSTKNWWSRKGPRAFCSGAGPVRRQAMIRCVRHAQNRWPPTDRRGHGSGRSKANKAVNCRRPRSLSAVFGFSRVRAAAYRSPNPEVDAICDFL